MNKFVKGMLVVLAGGAIIGGISLYQTVGQVKETAAKIYEPLPPLPQTDRTAPVPPEAPERQESKKTTEQKPITILLFGVDEREGDKGRTDTLMFLSFHPQKKQSLMISIPRDTRTTIAGRGFEDKINHAYSWGGIASTVGTVQDFFDTPIDYYVHVNMEGFSEIVDTLGGVTVDNPFAFSYEGYDFPQGMIQLDGNTALAYVRMRYEDPQGDLGRNKRQQQIIRQLMDKAKQTGTFTKLDQVLATVANNLKTNLTYDDMKAMLFAYRDSLETIEVVDITGSSALIGGVYYYIVPDSERQRIQQRIDQFLLPQQRSADEAGTGPTRAIDS